MQSTRTTLEIAQQYIAQYQFEHCDAAGNLRVHRPSAFQRRVMLDAILGLLESEEFCRALVAELQHFSAVREDPGGSDGDAKQER